MIPEKRETNYVNSTINLGSNLQITVQEGHLKQNRVVSELRGQRLEFREEKATGSCGAETHKRKLCRGRSLKIFMGSP